MSRMAPLPSSHEDRCFLDVPPLRDLFRAFECASARGNRRPGRNWDSNTPQDNPRTLGLDGERKLKVVQAVETWIEKDRSGDARKSIERWRDLSFGAMSFERTRPSLCSDAMVTLEHSGRISRALVECFADYQWCLYRREDDAAQAILHEFYLEGYKCSLPTHRRHPVPSRPKKLRISTTTTGLEDDVPLSDMSSIDEENDIYQYLDLNTPVSCAEDGDPAVQLRMAIEAPTLPSTFVFPSASNSTLSIHSDANPGPVGCAPVEDSYTEMSEPLPNSALISFEDAPPPILPESVETISTPAKKRKHSHANLGAAPLTRSRTSAADGTAVMDDSGKKVKQEPKGESDEWKAIRQAKVVEFVADHSRDHLAQLRKSKKRAANDRLAGESPTKRARPPVLKAPPVYEAQVTAAQRKRKSATVRTNTPPMTTVKIEETRINTHGVRIVRGPPLASSKRPPSDTRAKPSKAAKKPNNGFNSNQTARSQHLKEPLPKNPGQVKTRPVGIQPTPTMIDTRSVKIVRLPEYTKLARIPKHSKSATEDVVHPVPCEQSNAILPPQTTPGPFRISTPVIQTNPIPMPEVSGKDKSDQPRPASQYPLEELPQSDPPLKPKQPLNGFPPMWSASRQEMCESSRWFRSYQGGVYHKDGVVKGYFLSAFSARRDTFERSGKLIISHGGGKCDTDQTRTDASVRALIGAYEQQNPLVLFVDDKYAHFPLDLAGRDVYMAALGFYRVVHYWAEQQDSATRAVVRYKFAFEWCEGQGEPWWLSHAMLPVVTEQVASKPDQAPCPTERPQAWATLADQATMHPSKSNHQLAFDGKAYEFRSFGMVGEAAMPQRLVAQSQVHSSSIRAVPSLSSVPSGPSFGPDPYNMMVRLHEMSDFWHVFISIVVLRHAEIYRSPIQYSRNASGLSIGDPSHTGQFEMMERDETPVSRRVIRPAPAGESKTQNMPSPPTSSASVDCVDPFGVVYDGVLSDMRPIQPPRLYAVCPHCRYTSPRVYTLDVCLNQGCSSFWTLQPGEQIEYRREFLETVMNSTPIPKEMVTALLPRQPSGGTSGTSYKDSRGWHCFSCGRVSCRSAWDMYQCPTPTCNRIITAIRPASSFAGLSTALLGGSREWVASPDSGISVLEKMPFHHHCRTAGTGFVQTFVLPYDKGRIHVIRGSAEATAAEVDTVFEAYQAQAGSGALAFRRWPLRNHKRMYEAGNVSTFMLTMRSARSPPYELLLAKLQVCPSRLLDITDAPLAGERYHYVGATDHTVPFAQTAPCVIHARDLIQRRCCEALGHQDFVFNEVLSAGYMERQKMAFHSDSEKGLGPNVAGLSMGAPAVMHFQPTLRYAEHLKTLDGPGAKTKTKGVRTCLSVVLKHGDVCLMEGTGVQDFYQHTVVPSNFRIAATARWIEPSHEIAGGASRVVGAEAKIP
ncbi:unnamed protein product [Mycena citricolor]|uniref:Alpha-ketoglutarate-dependent dioxygenase AlkB-like domain-containing protein n=1 Tax=Mycena citricolor TaxID=2018698 RepID=A0AAD2JYV0_9AGAR|nr:unnamed protein product [Mycena citricolor]